MKTESSYMHISSRNESQTEYNELIRASLNDRIVEVIQSDKL